MKQMEHFKKISFLALVLGWIGQIITHITLSIWRYESASGGEIGVVLFWSAVFMLIFYGLFILLPKKWIVELAEKFGIVQFTVLSGVYGLIGFTVLIGWGFLMANNFHDVFLDAFVSGLIFGFTFHYIWNNQRNQIDKTLLIPIIATPTLFLFIYLFAFPKLFPSYAYNLVPQYIRHDILINTIPKFKVGDDLSELQKALPGQFEVEECYGGHSAYLENFQYVVEVNCCKIVRIEFGPRQNTAYSMGGGAKKPCI